MIEEIIGIFASLVSMITSGPPRLSPQSNIAEAASEDSRNNGNLYWHGNIHSEYEDDGSELPDYFVSSNYISLGSGSATRRSFCQSILRSLRANLSFILAVFPLSSVALAWIYVNLNTADLCLQWQYHNHRVPSSVKRWRLIGENIDDMLVYIWFAVYLAILFGWREFKANYMSTLYVGFGAGAAMVIYKAYLVIFGVLGTRDFYRYPGNCFFFVVLVYSSIIVAKKIRKVHPSISLTHLQIVTIISLNFMGGFAIGMAYSYAIIPYFNQQDDKIFRALVVAVAPVVACIPTGLSKYFTLKRSREIVEPQRSFVLIYFLRAGTIAVYRLMQAGFQSRWIFIGLSLLHGFPNVVDKATERLRVKLWTRFMNYLRSTCFQWLEEMKYDTPHHRRLKADLGIQYILFNYTTLVLSQAHFVLYRITSVEVPVWPIISESFIRIAIGLGIDLFFNFLAVFIQLHWYDIPLRRVWLKYWRRHLVANAVILIGILSYFTNVLLTVFQRELDNGKEQLILRNCTMPFSSW